MFKRRLLALATAPLLALAVIAILLAARDGQPRDPSETTAARTGEGETGAEGITQVDPSLEGRLDRLHDILSDLEEQAAPVSSAELQRLTEQLASTTAVIRDAEPGSLRAPHAESYFQVTVASLRLLERIEVAAGARPALLSARGIAEFGRDTVARYLIATQVEVTGQANEAPQLSAPDPA